MPKRRDKGSALEAVGPSDDPLTWLGAEAQRLTKACLFVANLSQSQAADQETLERAVRDLQLNLTRLFQDEAVDVFPLLAARAQKGDDYKTVIATLQADHTDIVTSLR